MIDENHQNKGYGREAMKLIIEEVRTFPKGEANAFYTSTSGEAALRACLASRFRRFSESFFARQEKPDDAKPKLLLGGIDAVLAENKPEKRRNGDTKQALSFMKVLGLKKQGK